nr:nucleotidyltransferase domain-containing protein [uncultured Rhodopila sp.]
MARSSPRSAQRYPLTATPGTEANVRLLRELFRHGGQTSAPHLAARTGLARAGVRAGLAALEGMGIVASARTGRTHLYNACADHPLSACLAALFEAEEARFTAIRDTVRSAAAGSGADVIAAWIYGSVARGEDRPNSDVGIAVVAAPAQRARVLDPTRAALVAPAATLGFVPSVIGLDRGDLRRLAREHDPWWRGVVADAIVLAGPRPDELAARLRGEAAAA